MMGVCGVGGCVAEKGSTPSELAHLQTTPVSTSLSVTGWGPPGDHQSILESIKFSLYTELNS